MADIYIGFTDKFEGTGFLTKGRSFDEICKDSFGELMHIEGTDLNLAVKLQYYEKKYEEMEFIKKQGYEDSFIIASAVSKALKEAGYYCCTMGCESNSIIAYLLGITDIKLFHNDSRIFLRPDKKELSFSLWTEPGAQEMLLKLFDKWQEHGIRCMTRKDIKDLWEEGMLYPAGYRWILSIALADSLEGLDIDRKTCAEMISDPEVVKAADKIARDKLAFNVPCDKDTYDFKTRDELLEFLLSKGVDTDIAYNVMVKTTMCRACRITDGEKAELERNGLGTEFWEKIGRVAYMWSYGACLQRAVNNARKMK